VKRREFLIQTAKATAAAAAFSGAGLWLSGREPRSAGALFRIPDYSIDHGVLPADLAVVRGADAGAMVEAAVRVLGGIEQFVKPGERVLIKPNVGFDRPPILGATTSPDVVRAVIRLCRAAGAREIIVSDNPINSPTASFARSGIRAVVDEEGASVHFLSVNDFETTDIGGIAVQTFGAAAGLLKNVDRVIGVPTLKDHNLSGMSFAMKNWYGLLGEGRNRFHQDIHNVVADLAMMIRPTLIIGDATRILMRNGPTGGSPADVAPGNTILASVDAVAIDAVGLSLLGKTGSACPSIQLAADRGIGVADLNRLRTREMTV
jgi:uncharacterized protein (DUF362 family)